MATVITRDGTIKIGVYHLPERKKPCLCIEEGNTLTKYGTFNNEGAAAEFMDKLADLVRAERGTENG